MWDGQASIHSSLQGTEHLVACGGSGKSSIQVAGEGSGLTVDALHVELITGDLHLAFVHLIQAKLVQQLTEEQNISAQSNKKLHTIFHFMSLRRVTTAEHISPTTQTSSDLLCEPAADQCSKLLRSSSGPRSLHI